MKHNPGRFSQRDANHEEVKGWYEEMFCSVVDLHILGFGCPDFLIGCAGRSELVEVKTEHGQLEGSQVRFQRDWRGSKVKVVRTHEDCINHVQEIRERVSRGRF